MGLYWREIDNVLYFADENYPEWSSRTWEEYTGGAGGWDVSNVTNFNMMFQYDYYLYNISAGDWCDQVQEYITSNRMFEGCTQLPNYDASCVTIDAAHSSSDGRTPLGYFNTAKTSIYWKQVDDVLYFDNYLYPNYAEYTGSEGPWDKTITSVVINNRCKLPGNCQKMFYQCTELTDLDLSKFDSDFVADTSYAFAGCTSLLNVIAGEYPWGVSVLGETASHAFDGCTALQKCTLLLNARDISYAFKNCTSLTDVAFPEPWLNQNQQGLFYNCKSLTSVNCNGTTYSWGADKSYMFYGCSALRSFSFVIYAIDATTTSHMFDGCSSLTSLSMGYIERSSTLTTSIDVSYMFANCTSLQDINMSGFYMQNATDMRSMFANDKNLRCIYAPNWVDQATPSYSTNMFYNCENLPNFTSDVVNLSAAHDCNDKTTPKGYLNKIKFATYYKEVDSELYLRGTYEDDYTEYTGGDHSWANTITGVNVETACKLPSDCHNMFANCSLLTSVDLSKFNTSSTTNIKDMFNNCTSLTNIDLSAFDTSKMTNVSYLFDGCTSLETVSMNSWVTTAVLYMSGMFKNCSNLKSININDWDISTVTRATELFSGCNSLESIDLSNWITSALTTSSYMFANCSNLKQVNIENFDVTNDATLQSMFYNDSELEVIYAKDWVDQIPASANSTDMFYNCVKLPNFTSAVIDATAAHDCNQDTEPYGYFNTEDRSLYLGGDKVTRYYSIIMDNKKATKIYRSSSRYWKG